MMAATASGAADEPAVACDDSACSTPFVSAPSSPTRDRDRDPYPSHFFFSAPTSPTRGGGGKDAAVPGVLDFDFDFSSRFPSPSAAAMSSADELFHNGQIRPVRLAAALLQPHPDPAVLLDFPHDAAADTDAVREEVEVEADERGRVRTRSVRGRKARSMSPFRTHWRTASHVPAAPTVPVPEHESADEARQTATPAASRSSSSSSTASSASSASSSSSRGSRRWGGFLKDLLHRSKSDGGKTTHHAQHSHHAAAPASPTAQSKTSTRPSPSPAAAKGTRGGTPGHRGGRRRSAHERLYEARRAEAEEMRRRTSLPYRQGLLLFGCIGLGNRSSYGAVHGLARGLNAAAAVSSRS
ncbi:hypothetical protein BDA96_05G226800 [Sorghum bicolor]|uniref:Calmodulin-binding protein n=1 Tax=Sorghum bicolor TaxID=4558 RepID=A0A921R0C4_SORBI|nr:hypothetical protein BDA96_05G226800 [Sorghum bicolor]